MKRKPSRSHTAPWAPTSRATIYRAGHVVHPATFLIGQDLMGLLNGLELLRIPAPIRMLLARQILVGTTNLLL
jgi:hypothetical protein